VKGVVVGTPLASLLSEQEEDDPSRRKTMGYISRMPLTEKQVKRLRDRLVATRREILVAALERTRHLTPLQRELRGRAGDDMDDATEEQLRGMDLELGNRERRHLREIDAALRRMEDGTYGVCEATGEPIPYRRLEAMPTARYTVEAREALERGYRDYREHQPAPRDD
jgi:DnaK suppressor protein